MPALSRSPRPKCASTYTSALRQDPYGQRICLPTSPTTSAHQLRVVPRQLTNEHGVSWLRSAQHGPATLAKQASAATFATNAPHLLYAARRWVTKYQAICQLNFLLHSNRLGRRWPKRVRTSYNLVHHKTLLLTRSGVLISELNEATCDF